jgi:hypothetical protein
MGSETSFNQLDHSNPLTKPLQFDVNTPAPSAAYVTLLESANPVPLLVPSYCDSICHHNEAMRFHSQSIKQLL